MKKYQAFKKMNFSSADELWDVLSPTKKLAKEPCSFIYRGQGDASWPLIPQVLRRSHNPATILFGSPPTADQQVYVEIRLLKTFAEYCDSVGIRVPNDCLKFRETTLNPEKADKYLISPSLWPDPELRELMALAQHHRVPTRLLDWTRIPYVATYFAASSAMDSSIIWDDGRELAIWALNTERLSLYKNVKVINPPGAITSHLSAQFGLFTVHPHNGYREQEFQIVGLEEEFSTLPDTPLIQLTIPIDQSLRLLELCDKSGFSGARMYPSADGAGLAVMDTINAMARERHHNEPIQPIAGKSGSG